MEEKLMEKFQKLAPLLKSEHLQKLIILQFKVAKKFWP